MFSMRENRFSSYSSESEMEKNKSVLEEAARSAALRLGYPTVKPEQLSVIVEFLSGRDTFVVLPTGYGKSLCYGALPFAFDELEKGESSIVIVVSPLTAIMKDQVL